MAECKYIKRLEYYLDGWSEGVASKELEEHLKSCPECQTKMAELVEIGSAAQEIIDLAPDRGYWDSFASRVHKRIAARDIEPAPPKTAPPRYPMIRLASVLMIVGVFMVAAAISFYRLTERNQSPAPPPYGAYQFPPGFFPYPPPQYAGPRNIPPPPELNVPEVSHSLPPAGFASSSDDKGKAADSNFAATSMPDPALQFKAGSPSDRTEYRPSNEYSLAAPPSLNGNFNLSDPAFRLKSEFVGQRILAGLGMDVQNASPLAHQGLLYGYNSSSVVDNDLGASSGWGYLRDPADTSQSGEIKKYYIELELMQTK